MSDFENFKVMLSHGFPSNKEYIEVDEGKYKIIEKERLRLNGFVKKIVYEQFIFDENGEFINWQSMIESINK